MDEKLRPEEVRSFVHQRVSEHQGEGSMMTGAPCSLEPSSVDMNFLWAALRKEGTNASSGTARGSWLGNALSVPGDLCIPGLLDSEARAI